MIRVDAEVVAHLVADISFIVVVFIQHEVIAHAVAATVFHHVAASVLEVHAVHGDLPKVGEHARNVIVVGARAVVDVVDDGGFTVLEDVPRAIVTHPIGVGRSVDEGHIAHVDTCALETVLGLVLLRGADDAIHHAVVGKLRHKACRNAQGITDHHALHGFKLCHETRLARRRVGLDEVHATRGVVHLCFGEIVPSHPIGFLLLGLHRSGHQE